jgi:protein-tyrosine phosphatase
MERGGLDISGCRSQPVTEELVRSADLILTLTGNHKRAIDARWPDAASRTRTVHRDGRDVSDPIGMPVNVYQGCADQIEESLQEWAEKLSPQLENKEGTDGHEG